MSGPEELRALVEALKPFAWIGQWLFARNLPDDTPMVLVEGVGKPVALTRGMFKAAHAALTRAESSLASPAGMEGWMPIETAPKDGTEILLYGPGVLFVDGRTGQYAPARHVGWWSGGSGGHWLTRDPHVTCRATHWMPLPAAPRGESE